jgi:NAD(P)-dependent dehydrogenase (short-subunit alcohol dehydrogenase family)
MIYYPVGYYFFELPLPKHITMPEKNVIVTGGAQGIGKGICKFLIKKGYSVTAMDIDAEALNELLDELKTVNIVAGDVSNEADIIQLASYFENKGLTGLVNNAAIGMNKKVPDLTREEWDRVLAINLTGSFLMAKYTHEHLKKSKGAIVNIASTRAIMSEPNTEAYSATKGGIVSLTHALAMSFAPDVRVNCISPGWIEVGDFKKKSDKLTVHHTEADNMQHPAGRVGIPDDIASMVEYLLSDKSSFITGQNFVIDGGMTKKIIYV